MDVDPSDLVLRAIFRTDEGDREVEIGFDQIFRELSRLTSAVAVEQVTRAMARIVEKTVLRDADGRIDKVLEVQLG